MADIPTVLTTARLTLEPLREDHTASIIKLFANPAMSTYLGMDLSRAGNAEAMMQRRLRIDDHRASLTGKHRKDRR